MTWRAAFGRRPRGLAGALLLVTAASCGGIVSPPPPPNTQALVRSELYFGRLRPDDTVVTDAEWRAFVADEITPRFPDGFTVFDALGQYRGRDGRIVSEPTKVLLIVHGPEPRLRDSIQALRDVYRRQFQQESVLLIESPTRAGF